MPNYNRCNPQAILQDWSNYCPTKTLSKFSLNCLNSSTIKSYLLYIVQSNEVHYIMLIGKSLLRWSDCMKLLTWCWLKHVVIQGRNHFLKPLQNLAQYDWTVCSIGAEAEQTPAAVDQQDFSWLYLFMSKSKAVCMTSVIFVLVSFIKCSQKSCEKECINSISNCDEKNLNKRILTLFWL